MADGYDSSMDLTPELLRTVEFNDAKKGGYDHDEVDEFLDRAAADLARQHEQIRAVEGRITEAERRAAEAESQARDHSDSDETLRRTLVLAQRTADAAIKEAEDDAARIVAESRQKADGLIASAEEQVRREVGATRDRLQAEIRELEARRAELGDQITELSTHLDDERARIGARLDDLRERLRSDSMGMAPTPGDDPDLSDSVDGNAAGSATTTSDTGPDPDDAVAGADEPVPSADSDAVDLDGPVDEAERDDLSDLPPPPVGWESDADEVDDDEPSDDDGPPTQATPVVERDNDVGSSHLDELRRAVSDGSTETTEEGDDAAMAAFFDQDDDPEPQRRFGRRR